MHGTDRTADHWGDSPAILVVDVARQRADPDLDTSYPDVVEAVDHMSEVLAVARDAGLPIFFSRGGKSYHTSSGGDMTPVERGGWAKKNEIRDESAETAETAITIASVLNPQDGEVIITKSGPSAFFKTMLPVYLSSLAVDTLVIMGRTASGCVRATVTDAFSHDYHVVLPEECITDSRAEAYDHHMREMDRKYATVEPLEAVLGYLRE